MITATDRDLPALTRAGDPLSVSDAGLFLLIDELRTREKRRDDLLDRLSIEESDQIEAAAKRACDAARAIYERIAAIKPTTAAGVLRQLELAAKGWGAPSTGPIAMAGLREIADRPLCSRPGSGRPLFASRGSGSPLCSSPGRTRSFLRELVTNSFLRFKSNESSPLSSSVQLRTGPVSI